MAPTYLSKCSKCGKELEYWAKISEMDSALPNCEECGVKMDRAFVANEGGFLLNGAGWPGQTYKRQKLHKAYVNGQKDWRKP